MKENNKDLNYYLSLPYSIEILRDNDEENPGWVAKIKDLPGCITQADSFEELGEMIEDAKRSWIEVALEDGIPVPEPRLEEDYSGKFVVRLPKSLHRELAELSDREEVSLNTLVLNMLAKSVGMISHSPKITIEESEIQPGLAWPRISEIAQGILLDHGLSNEVQEINETLFANWVADHIYQADAALKQKDNSTALKYIKTVEKSLEILCNQSPFVTILCNIISILEKQILINSSLVKGIIEQEVIRQKISVQAFGSFQTHFPTDLQRIIDIRSQINNENLADEDKTFLQQKFPNWGLK